MRLAHIRHQADLQESAWQVLVVVAIAIGLQFVSSNVLVFGFTYALVGLEAMLLLVLSVIPLPIVVRRVFATFLIALVSLANIVALGLVLMALFGNVHLDGRELLVSSVAIYLTNIIVFGLWYWELDDTRRHLPDFLFPQMTVAGSTDWRPTLFDYLYVSVTNAMNLSPGDASPLTHRAKFLMMIQSVVSLVTLGLVVARAVNILA